MEPLLEHLPTVLVIPDPLVLQGLLSSQSLSRVDFQQSFDQFSTFTTQVFRQLKCFEVVLLSRLRKGRLNHEHFVHKYSYTPAVDFVIVVAAVGHLRRNVVESAAESPTLSLCLDRPSEVSYLQLLSKGYHVLRLQVSMNYPIPVQVLNSRKDLSSIPGSLLLRKGTFPQNLLVEIAVAELDDQKDFVSCEVVAIGGQDVGMGAVEMDLHFVN